MSSFKNSTSEDGWDTFQLPQRWFSKPWLPCSRSETPEMWWAYGKTANSHLSAISCFCGLNWQIRKRSRIWSLESPGQRACNISLSLHFSLSAEFQQKADSNNINPQLKPIHTSPLKSMSQPISSLHSVKRTCCHVALGQTGLFKILSISWV